MTARQTQSAPGDVGYGKPPRHTQFRKGQSGNPGGRPRGEPIERLKALTLQEAYRGVIVRREDGIAEPAQAIQAILRSQIELAMAGNVRAQRDILKAVQTFEREDAKAAALEAYVAELVAHGMELEKAVESLKSAATTMEEKIDYAAAAREITELLGLNKIKRETAQSETSQSETAQSETCAPGKEKGAGSGGVLAAGSAETHTGDADEAKPAAPAAGPRLSRLRPERRARHRAQESRPSAGAARDPAQQVPPAQPAAKIGKFPVKFPVFRECGLRGGRPGANRNATMTASQFRRRRTSPDAS
jgi:hypothetical protein